LGGSAAAEMLQHSIELSNLPMCTKVRIRAWHAYVLALDIALALELVDVDVRTSTRTFEFTS